MPHFAKGAEQAEAASKAAGGSRADFLSIKPGKKEFLRPISDLAEIIPIDVHMGVPTRKPPKGTKADKWPEQMSAICRNADAFRVRDADGNPTNEFETDEKGRSYGDCYIHANMQDVLGKYKKSVARTVSQTWGLFAVREPVHNDGGKLIGFKDKTEEYKDEDGKLHRIPKIVIASQSWTNFWAAFSAAGYMTGTICDRDFSVERVDNDYVITPGRETADLHPDAPAWKRYTDAMALKGVSVEKVLLDQSSVEYYGRFFDPDWKDPDADESEDEEGSAEVGGAEASITDEEAEAMKAKLAKSFSSTNPT
jgi:hypothetical protein